MNPHVLRERVAAEVHDGGDGACLQVDAFEGVDAVVDEEGVELLPRRVMQHLLFPAAVRLHFAVPFAVFVESQGIPFHFVADGIKDDGLVVGVGKEVKFVVDGVNRIIDWVGNPKVGANASFGMC